MGDALRARVLLRMFQAVTALKLALYIAGVP